MAVIPEHYPEPGKRCEYLDSGMCYRCCIDCNLDRHLCPGCGEPLDHNGIERRTGEKHSIEECVGLP